MNMLRHRKTCKLNVENHFDNIDRNKQNNIELQKQLLIKDFQNLSLDVVSKKIQKISDKKVKDSLIEYFSNQTQLLSANAPKIETKYVNPEGTEESIF